MPANSQGPFFNLKAVIKQTGIKPDTLRAWERRHGLPSPKRSGGGHRLYSPRDIDIIRWLMDRHREGMRISRAVELWHLLEAEGRDPLQMVRLPIAQVQPAPAPLSSADTLSRLRDEWIAASLAFDEHLANQILVQAFALYSPEVVCLELLEKAIAQIGEGWSQGRVIVQQEHFVSALVIRHLEALIKACPPPIHPGRILAACPPAENHTIGLLLITFLIRRRGWDVLYLGANTPVEKLESAVMATKPLLVILSAQQLHTAATLLEVAQVLQREGVAPAYGGLIFNLIPELRGRTPGHFLGERVDLAPPTVESLLTTPRPVPAVAPVPEAYRRARTHYLERQALIEARLIQAAGPLGIAPDHLALANRELALNIAAALALGNMDYLSSNIEWAQDLIRNYRIPAEALYPYLQAYGQAAAACLDKPGEPVVAWFRRLAIEP